ncbi:MAG: hypothetical protein RR555_05420 [Bacteroidales bacterium]
MKLITPEYKDDILNRLFNHAEAFYILFCDDEPRVIPEVSDFDLIKMLNHFEEKGLIKQQRDLGGVEVEFTVNAHDFIRLGGFKAQDELLKANIEKLGLEIDTLCKDLAPDQLDKATKIATIGSAILSALSLIK